jgi:DNA-binding transcriptional ArsR family regulator
MHMAATKGLLSSFINFCPGSYLFRSCWKYRLTVAPCEHIFNAVKIDEAAARLEALGNPTRLKIYRALVRAGELGQAVGKLQARLGIPASTLSHHLKTLLIVGLITQQRDATTLICRANYPVMKGLIGFLTEECCIEEKSSRSDAA